MLHVNLLPVMGRGPYLFWRPEVRSFWYTKPENGGRLKVFCGKTCSMIVDRLPNSTHFGLGRLVPVEASLVHDPKVLEDLKSVLEDPWYGRRRKNQCIFPECEECRPSPGS